MPKIDINLVKGLMPKLSSDKLPEGMGQLCNDAVTASGALQAYKRSSADVALTESSYETLFEYLANSTSEWVTYNGAVYWARSHVAEDTHERLYVAGESGRPAKGTLTLDTIPTAADTMTIDTTVYLFVAVDAGANPLDIEVGGSLEEAQENIRLAILGEDGWNGEHATVTPGFWAANDLVLTASSHGIAGDTIVTTETYTAGTNVFDAVTLGTTQAGQDDGLYKAFANDLDSTPWDQAVDFYYPGHVAGTAPTITAQTPGATYLAYYYTYVSRYGEESEGSAITEITNQTVDARVHVDDIQTPVTGHGMTTVGTGVPTVRIYRSATDGQGGAEFLQVCEADWFSDSVVYVAGDYTIYANDLYECTVGGTGTWAGGTHTFLQGEAVSVAELGLSTTGDTYLWRPAEDDLTNLRSHPNGFFVASKDNEIHFSEPFYHHAWPEDYVIYLDAQIVGLGIFGSTIVVATDANIYTLSGPHPDSLYKQRHSFQPCLSQRAVVEIDDGVMFPSAEGFQLVNASGVANVTADLFKPSDWEMYYLSTMHGVWYNKSYIGFYSGTNGDGYVRIDFTNNTVTAGAQYHYAAYVSIVDGIFRTIAKTSLTDTATLYISRWNYLSTSYRNFQWKTGRYIFTKPCNMSVAQVYLDIDFIADVEEILGGENTLSDLNAAEWALGVPDAAMNDFVINAQDTNGDNLYDLAALGVQDYVTFNLYADSVLKFTKQVTSSKMFKLPRGYKAKEWEVELVGMITVRRIVVSTTTKDLI